MLLRILQLYSKFWCVLVICKGLDVLFFGEQLKFREFLGNFTGIHVTYNGTWWFLLQYVEMLLFLPLLDLFFTRFSSPSEQKKKHITFAVGYCCDVYRCFDFYMQFPAACGPRCHQG